MEHELKSITEWARERLRANREPPWAYYRLMQLIEAAEELREGLGPTRPGGDSREPAEPEPRALSQGAAVVPLHSGRRHPDRTPGRLPT